MIDKPIPAFYCCYLLRSRNHKTYYIGSTPNPARRLRQHNGESKGGAKHTSFAKSRPWEMACIVTGFQSKFAALQFEWSWQNTHLTRHISKDVREARLESMQKGRPVKPAAGQTFPVQGLRSPRRRRHQAPKSLQARLENLHHLLGVRSFSRWPLQVRFFAPDVFNKWQNCRARSLQGLPEGLKVELVQAEIEPTIEAENQPIKVPSVISAIEVGYADSKSHLEKSRSIFDTNEPHYCAICRKTMYASKDLILVCPTGNCRSVSHLKCLARSFLDKERDNDVIIPTHGSCPQCKSNLEWATLLKELSLRTRGQNEVDALFKPRRRRIKHVSTSEGATSVATSNVEEDGENESAESDNDDWLLTMDDMERDTGHIEGTSNGESDAWPDK